MKPIRHMKQSTPATDPWRTFMYGNALGERSIPVTNLWSRIREEGPATFIEAYPPVTGVTWTCHSGCSV